MFHYGYFVKLPDGQLVPAGDDWGPTKDTFKVGDSLGVKNGTEGIVIGVTKPNAKAQVFDVIVIVEQRAPSTSKVISPVITTFPGSPPQLPGPSTIQTSWPARNVRAVAIWNTVILRPLTETFHEFLVEVPLKGTFGEAWYRKEMAKNEALRHSVIRWLAALRSHQAKHKPLDHKKGQVFAAPATGEVVALIALAHDLYLLQKVNRLPKKLVNRLRNFDEFQGARYEVAIAATFVKCGFQIEWDTDAGKRHPEFIARNKRTGEELSVETKSRHRRGVLNQPGAQADQVVADVDQLYSDALGQDSGNRPFAIFLDVNLPPGDNPSNLADWQAEILARWPGNASVSLLGFTNFAWHYLASDQNVPQPREYFLARFDQAERPLKSPETVGCLQIAFDSYGICANEY